MPANGKTLRNFQRTTEILIRVTLIVIEIILAVTVATDAFIIEEETILTPSYLPVIKRRPRDICESKVNPDHGHLSLICLC